MVGLISEAELSLTGPSPLRCLTTRSLTAVRRLTGWLWAVQRPLLSVGRSLLGPCCPPKTTLHRVPSVERFPGH